VASPALVALPPQRSFALRNSSDNVHPIRTTQDGHLKFHTPPKSCFFLFARLRISVHGESGNFLFASLLFDIEIL